MDHFTEEHQDRYDHIWSGTHLDWVCALYDGKCRAMFARVHGLAKAGDLKSRIPSSFD